MPATNARSLDGQTKPVPSSDGLLEFWREVAAQGGSVADAWDLAAISKPGTSQAQEAYLTFLRVLSRASRRPLAVAYPGSPRMTRDEELILAILGNAQAGHWDLFQGRLSWLAPAGPRAVVAAAAMVLSDALLQEGIIIGEALGVEPPLVGAVWGQNTRQ